MVEMLEKEMTTQIHEVARQLGFNVTREPMVSNDSASRSRLLGRLRHPVKMKPDLLIEQDGKWVVVEVKRNQVLPGGVEQVLQYVDALGAKGLICVPDAVLPQIAASVTRYANGANVRICSLSEIGDVLTQLLSGAEAEGHES